jgi:hypothetical protein
VQATRVVTVSDVNAPVITVNGLTHFFIAQGDTYVDAGATAVDDVDGSVAVDVTGSVDTSTLGDYTITYTATDSSGNVATAARLVTVVRHVSHGSSGGSGGGTNTTPATGGQVLGAEAFNFQTDMGVGSTLDPDVTELQKILIADGYLVIPAPTGVFGPLTEAAVKLYQAAHGVPATGFVGPLTRAALNAGTVELSDEQKAAIAAKIAELLKQVQDLQAQLNATTTN